MSSEWESVELGDVASVRSGYAFKSVDWTDAGIPVVKIANVKSGRLEMQGCSHVDEETAAKAGDFRLSAGDILIAMTGYIGEVARVRDADLPCVLNQRVGKFDVRDDERLDPNYLFAVLTSREIRKTIESLGYGSAQPNVSPSLIQEVEISLPPLPEQRRIAKILGDLDEKIELNRKMNETLEQMARALFKSWFVDFDPVRAKMEGRTPTGMDAATAALFPNRLVDSELGPIPEGWEVKAVREIGDVICGKTPPTSVSEYYGDDIPLITIPDMHGNVFCATTARKLSHAGANSQANKKIPPGSLCVSCIATPGLVVITSEVSQTNQQINSVVPHPKEETYFWYWVMTGLGAEITSSGSGGSVLVNLSKGRFETLRVIKPPTEVIRAYHKPVCPMFETILANTYQSRTLSTLRDTLLPKLVSGEVRV